MPGGMEEAGMFIHIPASFGIKSVQSSFIMRVDMRQLSPLVK